MGWARPAVCRAGLGIAAVSAACVTVRRPMMCPEGRVIGSGLALLSALRGRSYCRCQGPPWLRASVLPWLRGLKGGAGGDLLGARQVAGALGVCWPMRVQWRRGGLLAIGEGSSTEGRQ